MRNYIILNDQNSNDISGLLIQSLAPISKPLMRTEIEEIDGRDGDIITPLGFSAYDKQITIGLYGTYDINAIIAFFNSEGTVTFSNEPDKYYNYQIYDQIDFERLVRFKTATVTLHCQPFKFATTGESQTLTAGAAVSGEGTNIVLEGSGQAPFSQFDLKGNTDQTGDPTPDAPIPVKVVTGENVINISGGKNLFNKDAELDNKYLDSNGVWQTSNTAGYVNQEYAIPGGQRLQLSSASIVGSPNIRVGQFSSDGVFIRRDLITSQSAGLLLRDNTARVVFSIDNVTVNHFNDLQIEIGSAATSYEAYKGNDYKINLGTLELCKLANAQDYIFKSGDKWYKHKAVGKIACSDYAWSWDSSIPRLSLSTAGMGVVPPGGNQYPFLAYSNKFKANTFTYVYTNKNNGMALSTSGFISLVDTSWTSQDDAVADIQDAYIYFALQIAYRTDEEITDESLIEQLEAIASQAHAYNGRTYVGSNYPASNVPHIIAAAVTGDASGTVTNAGNIYSKPKLTVYGSGDIGIYLNGVQMFQITLGSDGYITIDTNLMEAYKDNLQTLKNRQVTGDYSNFKLPVGQSTISFSGIVTSCVVENFSRWL